MPESDYKSLSLTLHGSSLLDYKHREMHAGNCLHLFSMAHWIAKDDFVFMTRWACATILNLYDVGDQAKILCMLGEL